MHRGSAGRGQSESVPQTDQRPTPGVVNLMEEGYRKATGRSAEQRDRANQPSLLSAGQLKEAGADWIAPDLASALDEVLGW